MPETESKSSVSSLDSSSSSSSWSPDKIDLQRAQELMDEDATVNLDEVIIDTITVSFVEWVPTAEGMSEQGGPIATHYKPQVRKAEIADYVPMYLLNKMIAGQKKAQWARERFLAGDESFTQDPMLAWMADQVLAVWKLSEPDMTPERFARGLNFKQVKGLFARFFGDLLRLPQSKV